MPFESKKQSAWAFATKQPFAKKWAKITDYMDLPDRKKKKKKKDYLNG